MKRLHIVEDIGLIASKYNVYLNNMLQFSWLFFYFCCKEQRSCCDSIPVKLGEAGIKSNLDLLEYDNNFVKLKYNSRCGWYYRKCILCLPVKHVEALHIHNCRVYTKLRSVKINWLPYLDYDRIYTDKSKNC